MTVKRMSLLLISAILICMSLVVFFERAIIAGESYGDSDFFGFYNSLLFFFSGRDIYSPIFLKLGPLLYLLVRANLNAPFMVLLALPLHVFNYARAFLIWNVISAGCILAGGYLTLRPFPQWHKYTLPILLLFLMYFPNIETLIYGEPAAVLLVVLPLAWLFARENKDIPAGIFIGLACAFKLFCGLFLIYFLCIKRFRLLLSAFLTMLATFLAGGIVFGFTSYLSYYKSLQDVFWFATSWNVSFNGFFGRLFSDGERNVSWIMAPHLASFLTLACSVILVAYLIWVWRKQTPQQFDRGFSLVLVSMLLLSPLGWIYYFPLLLIPYLLMVSEKNDWVHLAACILLLFSVKIPHLLLPSAIQTMPQIFWDGGVGFYVLLGMLVLLAKPYPEYRRFSPGLWGVIYALIFLPSIAVMVINFFSLTFGHRL